MSPAAPHGLVAVLYALLGIALAGTAFHTLATALVNLVDRGEPLRYRRQGVARLFREWGAHLLVPVAWLAGRLVGERLPAGPLPEGAPPPVILVPGYGLPRGMMLLLAAWLRRRGWPAVHAVDNRPRSAPIPVLATHLAAEVDRVRRLTGAPRVDLVGHSMGGLVAAWMAARPEYRGVVRRIVTLGTPWRGTRLHVLGRRRQARDLAPGSEVVEALREPPVPVTAAWSRTDPMISPPEHALPAAGDFEAVHLDDLAHTELLVNPRAWRVVRDALAAPEAEEGAGA